MTATVQQYGPDPILLVNFTGLFDVHAVSDMYRQCDVMAYEIDSPIIWRLIDMSMAEVDFSNVVAAVKSLDPHASGGFADERFHTYFCPSHPMAKLVIELTAKERYGAANLRMFPGLGEALLFVQDEMDRFTGAGV
ncbi:MAG: hypothetical protein AAF125_03035 [Chloroflexota bacterium]